MNQQSDFNIHKRQIYIYKILLIALAMILTSGIVVVSMLRDAIVNKQNWQFSFTGLGRVEYQPDTAKVILGVQIDRAEKAEEALQELNQKMIAITQAIGQSGIAEEDIITQNYTLSPDYEVVENVTELRGYKASQLIVVKVRNTNDKDEKISKVIEAASKAGVNQVQGITFETSRQEELKQIARLKAIDEAKKKADVLARELDVKLGEIVNWWENLVTTPTPYFDYGGGYGIGGGSGAPVIPSGDREVVVEVTITYQVK